MHSSRSSLAMGPSGWGFGPVAGSFGQPVTPMYSMHNAPPQAAGQWSSSGMKQANSSRTTRTPLGAAFPLESPQQGIQKDLLLNLLDAGIATNAVGNESVSSIAWTGNAGRNDSCWIAWTVSVGFRYVPSAVSCFRPRRCNGYVPVTGGANPQGYVMLFCQPTKQPPVGRSRRGRTRATFRNAESCRESSSYKGALGVRFGQLRAGGRPIAGPGSSELGRRPGPARPGPARA